MMTDEEKLISELCRAFEHGNADWFFNDNIHVSSVIFYTAAIRFVKKKPYENPNTQHRVLIFLEMMLDNAAEKMLAPVIERLDLLGERHAEIFPR